MTEQEQAPDNDDLASKTLRRVRKAELTHEKVKARLKHFHLFEDHEYENYKGERKKIAKAKRQPHDGPMLQMVLARRDRYESCVRSIERLEKLIGHGSDDAELIKQIVSLESIADRHAKGIETMLATFSKNDVAIQSQRARLLTSAASMAQADRHHADKLDMARKQNPGDMPDAELLKIANAEDIEATPDA